MNDITKLADEWLCEDWTHGELAESALRDVLSMCADELEAALAEYAWTKITDDPDTWPNFHRDILISAGDGSLEFGGRGWTTKEAAKKYFGWYWRYTGSLDTPPQESRDET